MPITPVEKIWMDGELVDWDKAQVHVLSHALHYGSGVFEGIRAYETSRGPAVWHLDEHLRRLGIVPQAVSGEPFDFIQSRIVEVPTGIEVRTLQELRDALLEVDQSSLYFHLVEARLRLGRGRNDFAAWLERGLGLPDLAARVQAVNPYSSSLEQTRVRLIALLDDALAVGAGR